MAEEEGKVGQRWRRSEGKGGRESGGGLGSTDDRGLPLSPGCFPKEVQGS